MDKIEEEEVVLSRRVVALVQDVVVLVGLFPTDSYGFVNDVKTSAELQPTPK